MKKAFKKWNSISLVLRILGGLLLGVIFGLIEANFAGKEVMGFVFPSLSAISILGTVFVGALKGIAPVLVFFLVMSAISKGGKSHSGVIRTVIILYMASTLLAAVVAVFASMIFKVQMILPEAVTDTTAPQDIMEVFQTLLLNVVSNPVSAIAEGNYIGILSWACVIGFALRKANDSVKNGLTQIADAISIVVTWIISFAPFGIFGLVFNAISTSGLDIFTSYGSLLLLLVGCMLFIYFVTNPILVWWCVRKNPFPLIFKCLRRSAITAFFTRSSAANIPVNMKVCEEMGLDKNTYSVSIPLGATINMDGAAITITVMTMATAATLGIPIDIPTALLLSLVATLSACGASGVAGGSLLLIPLACSLFGIPDDISYQVVAVGFIIGVVQDSVETALNSSSDLLLSISAELRNWRKEGRELDMKKLCK
ncbi:MAG: serine/threonine transporter SstT [Oscillospiraceae bacterium]|nr:serine/threonine transporter SstT [Oscillospiraceae bacterium]